MSEVSVRALGGEDWQVYRDVRLAALREAPGAFASSLAQESEFDEAFWRKRMARSARLLASSADLTDGTAAGIVSVGDSDEHDVAELFGLWVAPQLRGAGVAWKLVEAATVHAKGEGRRVLQAWISTDNGRAVAFFSSYGFRPTDQRRPREDAADEIAMVYPLGDDRGWVPPTA